MIRVRDVDLRLFNLRTRLPFRYGIVTLRACPHLFMTMTAEVDGAVVTGVSADHLPPKWLTKDPATSYADDVRDMLAVIQHAADCAVAAGARNDVYSLVSDVYLDQSKWGRERGFPPLLYNFGVSLIERAAIDAFCRGRRTTFAHAVHNDTLGIRLTARAGEPAMLDYVELAGTAPADWLPAQPLRQIIARHTVGLVDSLTDDEIAPADRVDDGLPQSLAAAIRAYGLTHFKLKIAGDVDRDLARLRRIFAVIAANVGSGDWGFTLDGNENYTHVEPFRRLWHSLVSDDTLRPSMRRLIFVEQPLHRDVAMSAQVKSAFADWRADGGFPPIIIDESDGHPGALLHALDCGYVGTSHKNCKGIAKGIANACLLAKRRRDDPGGTYVMSGEDRGTYVMSGEDLSNVGPVALLQDLAACATLGIESVERNGQHYFRGLSMHSAEIQAQVLQHHGDLYRAHERGGFATVDICNGRIETGTVVDAPFGVGFDLDVTPFAPLGDWVFESE